MAFSIVKVRSSLNYSLFGLKIKHIQGGIIDKMVETLLKHIEIYCVNCYHFPGPRRVLDTGKVRIAIDLQKLVMQRDHVQRAINFSRLRMPTYYGSQCNGRSIALN